MAQSTRRTEQSNPGGDASITATVECPPFYRLAKEEAALNRRELSKLYSETADVIGEVRYDLLWRLSEIGRISGTLEHLTSDPELPPDSEELSQLRERIAQLALEAVQMRQEARMMLNAYQKEKARYGEATATRAARKARNSARYTYSSAAL